MSSYETAPATTMLSTHCACCGRPLLDAPSVERGVGPECAKRYALPKTMSEDTRTEANRLIHACARLDATPDTVANAVAQLLLMECDKIADRIAKRAGMARVEETADGLDVDAPFSSAFLAARGRGRWVPEAKVTRYPLHAATDAARAITAAWGDAALVRLATLNGSPRYLTAADFAAWATERAAAAPAPVAAPEPPVRWVGSPTRVGAGWGVCIQVTEGDRPRKGDRVRVEARSGSSWTAALVTDAKQTKWGWVAETGRA